MVIYWCGFVASLDTNRSAGIMLSDKLPEQFIRYKPELVRNVPEHDNKQMFR